MVRKGNNTRSERGSDTAKMFVLIMFLGLGVATYIHDPILHSVPAYLFGWDIESFSTQLTTGETTAVTQNASLMQVWIYFMFPSLAIIALSMLVTIFLNNRLLYVVSSILIMMNFASFDPTLIGSDSNKAMDYLIQNGGLTTFAAYVLHIAILLFIIVVIALYWYVIFENNPKDANKRMGEVGRLI